MMHIFQYDAVIQYIVGYCDFLQDIFIYCDSSQ